MFHKINKILKGEDGQAMVEFALVAPIFILIFLVGTLQFGVIINYENGVLAAAREGARWGSITGDISGDGNRNKDIEEVVHEQVEKYIEMMTWDINRADISVDLPRNAQGGDPITVRVDYRMDLFIPWPDVFGGNRDITISHEVTTVLENI